MLLKVSESIFLQQSVLVLKQKNPAVSCSAFAQFQGASSLREIIVDDFIARHHVTDGRDNCITGHVFLSFCEAMDIKNKNS
jgi:hypothetical protein